MKHPRAALLHRGWGRSLFGDHAAYLSRLTGLPIVETDLGLDFAYLLAWAGAAAPACPTFVPYQSILLAADKRALAPVFAAAGVAVPETHLLESPEAVRAFPALHPERRWVLKWPLGCGALGHQIIGPDTALTPLWQPPFLVQELVELETPVVYRLYAVAGETFGWSVRKFGPEVPTSPWIAVARGAHFETVPAPPPEAVAQARRALAAVGLLYSFGVADLLQRPEGDWVVLEVNTDGLYEFVLREFGIPEITNELNERLAQAVQNAVEQAPNRSTGKSTGD